MSKSSPDPGPSTSQDCRRSRFSRKTHKNFRLPTPPPDPAAPEENFLRYLNALHKQANCKSDSIFAPVIATEDAFDHLEKLYKVMEQMLDLREQNARLLRKVRDLEQMKMMHKMAQENLRFLASDDGFVLDKPELKKQKTWGKSKLRRSLLKHDTDRSMSLNVMELPSPLTSAPPRQGSAKVSKWTKVKAAFRWEKASPTVTGAKSHDSGISGLTPINYEVVRYLRVPSTSEDASPSPVDSGAAGWSTPGTLSSASSAEDVLRNVAAERDTSEECDCDKMGVHPGGSHVRQRTKKVNSNKSNRSSWSKMKTAISPGEKKPKRDSKTCDGLMDTSMGSDDVFENESSQNIDCGCDLMVPELMVVPEGVVARYQQAVEDESMEQGVSKRVSKWTKVKKAFLPSPPTGIDQNLREGQTCQKSTDGNLEDEREDETARIKREIQLSYQQLQHKLGQEFQHKFREWEKVKTPASTSNAYSQASSHSPPTETRCDQAMKRNLEAQQMMRQENLPPEFKKKLEEWHKIKNSSRDRSPGEATGKRKLGELPKWKSVNSPAETNTTQYSEDFLKKLEQWRQIKSDSTCIKGSKGPSREDGPSTPSGREHYRVMEHQKRNPKLRQSISGKGEVLVHTNSGLYRFEGISKKFAQKLFEWEKARGIKPEVSTLALLTSAQTSPNRLEVPSNIDRVRSKSTESLTSPSLNQSSVLLSNHPSSLSLNDVEELERQCLDPINNNVQNYLSDLEDDNMDEPEAMIVEIEDVEEETASPMEEPFDEHHFPVYQRQQSSSTCQHSQSHVNIKRMDSKRADFDRTLVEDIVGLIQKIDDCERHGSPMEEDGTSATNLLEQIKHSHELLTKLGCLKERYSKSNLKLLSDDQEDEQNDFNELFDSYEDLLAKILHLAKLLYTKFHNSQDTSRPHSTSSPHILIITKELRSYVTEVKRILTYFYAASDMTAPGHKLKGENRIKRSAIALSPRKTESFEAKEAPRNKVEGITSGQTPNEFDKASNLSEDVVVLDPEILSKFVIPVKTVFVTEARGSPSPSSSSSNIQTPLIRTTRKLYPALSVDDCAKKSLANQKASSISLNVSESNVEPVKARPPPLASPASQRKFSKDISPSIRFMLMKYNQMIGKEGVSLGAGGPSTNSSGSISPVAWRSPVSERRFIAQREKYLDALNNLSPQSSPKEVRKSASVSTMASNLMKVSNQETDACKASEGDSGVGILRSTSDGYIRRKLHKPKSPPKLQQNVIKEKATEELPKLSISPVMLKALDERSKKLKRTKEEFLNLSVSYPATPVSAPAECQIERRFSGRNRYSQISMTSDSSFDSTSEGVLVKSASAGMINVDPDTYRQIDPAFHQEGYLSLPRSSNKPKEALLGGKLALSNIASKFRKVKMRRNMPSRGMSTVSALCRQSLVVDINPEDQDKAASEPQTRSNSLTVPSEAKASSSEDTSPSSSRPSSWIKMPKIFRKP